MRLRVTMQENPCSIPEGDQAVVCDPTLVVKVQLPLGWNTYLLFKLDVVNFEWKTDRGRQEALIFFFLLFEGALIVGE